VSLNQDKSIDGLPGKAMTGIVRLLICSVLGVLLGALPLAAQPRERAKGRLTIPSTRMTIVPPPCYEPIGSSPLLFCGTTQASLSVFESTRPFDQVIASYSNQDSLAAREFSAISRPEELTIDGLQAIKFSLRRITGLLRTEDQIIQVFVAGDSAGSFTVIAAYADTLNLHSVGQLVASVSTIHWDRSGSLTPMSRLGFSLDVKGGFKLTQSLPGWQMYTMGGLPPDSSHSPPAFIIRTSEPPTGLVMDEVLKAMMESMLQNLGGGVRVSRVIEFNKIVVDGVRAFETVSSGRRFPSDSTIAVYVSLILHPINYISMIGFSDASHQDLYIERFKEIVRSFKRDSPSPDECADCSRLAGAKHYAQALSCFESALRARPASLTARLGKADVLRSLKRCEEATREYDQIIEHTKSCDQAFLGRARCNTARKYYAEARADFDKTLGLNTNNLDAYLERAAVRKETWDRAGADSDYHRAIALAPDSAALYVMAGDVESPEEAITNYSRAINIDRRNARAFKKRGEMYYNYLGEYEDAIRDFSSAIRIDPADWMLYMLRGSALFDIGRDDEAVKDMEQATKGDSADAEALAQSGFTLGLTRHFDAAKKAFDRCFARDSMRWTHYLFRGIVDYLNGSFREASRNFRRASKLGPNAEARSWLYFSEFKELGLTQAKKNLQLYRQSGVSDAEDWGEIVLYILGEVSEERLIGDIRPRLEKRSFKATQAKIGEATSDTYFAIGMSQYITGLKIGAKKYWMKTIGTNAKNIASYQVARALLSGAWKE